MDALVPPQYLMANYFRRFCSDACKAEWHTERLAEREEAKGKSWAS